MSGYGEWLLTMGIAVSLWGAGLMVYDKWAATHRPRGRICERTLWFVALCGGATAMAVTMRVVRHKTRHRSFAFGMPLLAVAQWALAGIALYG